MLSNLIKKLGSYNPGGSSLYEGWAYQNFPNWIHASIPELSLLRIHRNETNPRLSVILENVAIKGKTVTDLGCNIGAFLLEFAKTGAECTGYDYDENNILFAREIAKQLNLPIDFRHSKISLDMIKQLPKTDIIVYLDTWMWQVKQYGLEIAKEILFELSKKCDVLFFSSAAGQNSMARMEGTNQTTIYNWLLQNTAFQKITKIYESRVSPWNGRNLYKCSQPKFDYNGWVSNISRISKEAIQKVFVNRYYNEFDLFKRHLDFLLALDKKRFDVSPKVLDSEDGMIKMTYEGVKTTDLSVLDLDAIVLALDVCKIKHRDITPDNLLWNGERVKLIDFDWAIWGYEKEWQRPCQDPRFPVYRFIQDDADNIKSLKRCQLYFNKMAKV